MKTRTDHFRNGMALALLALSILGAQACGDDVEPEPNVLGGAGKAGANTGGSTPKPSGDAGSGGTGNESPGPSPEAGTGGSDSTPEPSPEGGSAGAGGGGADGGGTEECFADPKKTEDNIEFLNRCPRRGTSCAPFDNASRIPGFTGTLPKL